MYENQYVGVDKIKGIIEEGDMSVISFKEKDREDYRVPTVLLKRLVTKEKNESGGSLFDMKLAAIAKDIVVLLAKAYHLKRGELDRLMLFVKNVIDNDHASATAILWGKHATQISLEEIDQILVNGAKKLAEVKENLNKDRDAKEIIAQKRAEAAQRSQ